MKKYVALGGRVLGFLILFGLFTSVTIAAVLNPLLIVPEMGDDRGMIAVNESEFFALVNLLQLLTALATIALFRINAAVPFPFFQMPAAQASRQALWGTAAGFLLILAAAFLLYLPGLVGFQLTPFSGRELLATFVLMVLVGLSEEIIFRGYVLQELSEQVPVAVALAISAVIFALAHSHSSNYNWLSFLNIFLSGLLLGLAYFRFDGIWLPVGLHFGWNFMQGPILGFKVSGMSMPTWLSPEFGSAPAYIVGDAYGLEGTVITALLQLVAIGWLYAGWKRKEAVELQPETVVGE